MCSGVSGYVIDQVTWCYDSTPIFPFPLLMCPHVPSVPMPPTHIPPSYASYHIPLTHSSMTHSSPLVLYTFPIWYAF